MIKRMVAPVLLALVPVFCNAFPLNELSIALTVGSWITKNHVRTYYVQVKSTGATDQQARDQAFKLAIEQAVGSLVTTETQVQLNQPVRREIINYSSGYINSFKQVSRRETSTGVELVLDVWVEHSAIADRLLSRSQADSTVPGDQINVRFQSVLQERQQGDRLLKQVLADYPQRAFDVKLDQLESRINESRNLELTLNLSIAWNEKYLNSLSEVLLVTATARDVGGCFRDRFRCDHSHLVKVIYRPQGDFTQTRHFLAFDDKVKSELLRTGLSSSQPVISITARDGQGKSIWTQCFGQDHLTLTNHRPARRYVHWDENRTIIDGLLETRSQIRAVLPPKIVTDVTKIQATIVPERTCK